MAAGTARFLFRHCYLSVIRVGLIGALRRWYRLILFFPVLFLYLRDERIGAGTPLLPSIFSLFVVIVLEIREERLGA